MISLANDIILTGRIIKHFCLALHRSCAMNVLAYLISPASSRSPDSTRKKTAKILFGGRNTNSSDKEQLQYFSNIVLDVDEGKSKYFDHLLIP
jgi:hypothetical protein